MRPALQHRYLTPMYDSARWGAYRPRAGDIVVCGGPKCGTTWTQMLCASLVHGSADLPLPLTRLSPWLDRRTQPIDAVIAELDAQPFRRILKTHTPLDGLPYHEDVSYVVCGRDPRDAFLSMVDHFHNMSPRALAEFARIGGKLPRDTNELFFLWMTRGGAPWEQDGFPFVWLAHFFQSYWSWRGLRNLHFLHYADLRADVAAEVQRLSAFLAISLPASHLPDLANAARFERMKEFANEMAPGAHLGEWTSNSAFFRKGRVGEWREALTAENQALYDSLMGECCSPVLRAWLESGHAAGEPQAL